LKLTDDQKQKWEAIAKEQSEKAKELHGDTASPARTGWPRSRKCGNQPDAKIKALLTPEQQEKVEKPSLRKPRGGGRGVQGAVKRPQPRRAEIIFAGK